MVSLISRLVACSPRIECAQTDRQTDRTTTVTLAAHARRGLMSKVQTLGARAVAGAWCMVYKSRVATPSGCGYARLGAWLVAWAIIIIMAMGAIINMRTAN